MLDIYLLEIDGFLTKDEYIGLLNLVSPEKKEKIEKLRDFEDAQSRLFGDLLIRKIIKDKLGLKNNEINFGVNEYNKPYLCANQNFHYNLSHSGKYIVCAVSDRRVGVDIETIKPINKQVAKRFFTYDESQYILSKLNENQTKAFYEIWTKKEAYVKCMGKGLKIPLNTFNVFAPEISCFFYCALSNEKAICHVYCESSNEMQILTLSQYDIFFDKS